MIVQNERKGLKFSWLNIYFKFKWHLKIKWFKLKNPRRSMFESYQSQHLFFCFVLFCFILFYFVFMNFNFYKKNEVKKKHNVHTFFYTLLLLTSPLHFCFVLFSSLSFLSSLSSLLFSLMWYKKCSQQVSNLRPWRY